MVTIKDIAKEANVSYTAVSIVLGEREKSGRVSEAMRIRIKEIAHRLGYIRNAVATNMRHGSTKVIVFISSDISQEYASRVLDGASMEIDNNHFFLKMLTVRSDEGLKKTFTRMLEQRPSGLIIRGLNSLQLEILIECMKTSDTPIAYVDNYEGIYGAVNVISDDVLGMEQVVEHLYMLGHRKIAHISNGLKFNFAARRYQGFCRCLERHGLPIDKNMLFEGLYNEKPEDFYAFVENIISGKSGVTAICTCSDFHASSAVHIVQCLGKKVPYDISITGYGDLHLCDFGFPTLTTVKQPFEKMGMIAAANLIKAIQGKDFESQITVPTELAVRDSSSVAKVTKVKLKDHK